MADVALKTLMPLRIPGGWAVTYNTYFADEPPVVRNGEIENFEFFKEDLLQIRQLTLRDGSFAVDRTGLLVDVGWFPDADPGGQYTLVAIRGGDWDNPVMRMRSRDIRVVADALESFLADPEAASALHA